MRAWFVAGALFACVTSTSCGVWDWGPTKPDPRYCDATTSCRLSAYPTCDLVKHECEPARACSSDPDCAGTASAPRCDTGSGHCVACLASADCADAVPICGADHGCHPCTTSDDAACEARSSSTKACDSAAGQCVGCLAAAHCASSPTTPLCGSDHHCRACTAHSDCPSIPGAPSGICVLDGPGAGACATADQVAFVDNAGMSPATCRAGRSSANGDAPATAYCDVGDALAEAKMRPFIVVKGSSTPYGAVAIAGRTVTILGPGKSATPTARLFTVSQPSVGASASGSQTSLAVLEGLDLGGDASQKASNGVSCTKTGGAATATVAVRNSLIHDSSGEGVLSSACALTLDANVVSGNSGGGVGLVSTAFTLTNNIVSGNGSGSATSPGVAIDNGSSGTFAFNTVVRNNVAAGVGGVDCGTGGTKMILDSIAYKNSTDTGTQLGAKCALSNIVTVAGDDNRGSMSAMAPVFLGPMDFRLKAGDSANAACCIDKIQDPGTPNKDHDVDNSMRPRGAGWDIGAHEAQ